MVETIIYNRHPQSRKIVIAYSLKTFSFLLYLMPTTTIKRYIINYRGICYD